MRIKLLRNWRSVCATPQYGLHDESASFVLPRLNELHLAARGTMNQAEHTKIFAEIGQLIFDNVQAVPLLWVPNAVIYDPEVVSEWVFPGSMINAYSHWDGIRAAQ